jgi:hypothetical protein
LKIFFLLASISTTFSPSFNLNEIELNKGTEFSSFLDEQAKSAKNKNK